MRFFNRKTAKQLRDDLEIFGKDRRQLHVDARVRGSSKRSRIGTFDMDSGTLTFDGTEWFADSERSMTLPSWTCFPLSWRVPWNRTRTSHMSGNPPGLGAW